MMMRLEKSRVETEKLIAREMPRLVKKYGEVNKNDVTKILRIEKENAVCEKCTGLPCVRNKTFIEYVSTYEGDDGKRYAEIRACLCKYQVAQNKMNHLKKVFKLAKIPQQYQNKTFSDYKVTADNAQAVKLAKEFVANGEGGLFFFGDPGTGKTFLASIVTQEFLKSNKSVIFGDVPTLLEALRSSFDDKNTKITDLMDDLATVDLLVLDDLGTENPTEWAVERIYSIINQRYNAEKPVIVTSNFRLKEIGARLNHPKNASNSYPSVTGDRIISRLAQMCKRVELKGKDWRF